MPVFGQRTIGKALVPLFAAERKCVHEFSIDKDVEQFFVQRIVDALVPKQECGGMRRDPVLTEAVSRQCIGSNGVRAQNKELILNRVIRDSCIAPDGEGTGAISYDGIQKTSLLIRLLFVFLRLHTKPNS